MIPPTSDRPIEVDVSIHGRPGKDDEIANITLGFGLAHVTYFIHRMPIELLAENLALSTLHEITHLVLSQANENYCSEKLARYGEDAMFIWLYGQDVLVTLCQRMQAMYLNRKYGHIRRE